MYRVLKTSKMYIHVCTDMTETLTILIVLVTYLTGDVLTMIQKSDILGNSGATSRDDAIFSGESLLRELETPGNLLLQNQFQKWSNSVPLIGQKNIFLANQRGVLAG